MSEIRKSRPLALADWLLAETTRRAEEREGRFVTDDAATVTAARSGGDTGRRIVERARRRPGGAELERAVGRLLGRLNLIPVILLPAGLLAGVGAAGAIETRPGVIALSHALAVLLLAPTLLLLLWAALSLGTRRDRGTIRVGGGLPGRIGWHALLPLLRRLGGSDHQRHLVSALGELGRRRGNLLMASATHEFWSAFFVGAIGALWLRFLGLRFDFSWETTLLSGDGMAWLIGALAALPAMLPGVDVPSPEQIQAVLAGQSPAADRALWARYLLGTLLVYGLAPRLILALVFSWRWRHCRLALELGRAGYVRVLPALTAGEQHTAKKIGPAPIDSHFDPGPGAPPGDGPVVLIGLELERDADRWPPDDTDALVLGRADDRAGRHELHAALVALDPRPERIIARCSARRSPDRGSARWLAGLRAIAPVEIELEDSARTATGRIRVEDWTTIARQHGLAFRECTPENPAEPQDQLP